MSAWTRASREQKDTWNKLRNARRRTPEGRAKDKAYRLRKKDEKAKKAAAEKYTPEMREQKLWEERKLRVYPELLPYGNPCYLSWGIKKGSEVELCAVSESKEGIPIRRNPMQNSRIINNLGWKP